MRHRHMCLHDERLASDPWQPAKPLGVLAFAYIGMHACCWALVAFSSCNRPLFCEIKCSLEPQSTSTHGGTFLTWLLPNCSEVLRLGELLYPYEPDTKYNDRRILSALVPAMICSSTLCLINARLSIELPQSAGHYGLQLLCKRFDIH